MITAIVLREKCGIQFTTLKFKQFTYKKNEINYEDYQFNTYFNLI